MVLTWQIPRPKKPVIIEPRDYKYRLMSRVREKVYQHNGEELSAGDISQRYDRSLTWVRKKLVSHGVEKTIFMAENAVRRTRK